MSEKISLDSSVIEYWILNKTEADEPPFFTSNGIVPLK